ncbi:MAG: MFS transporter [Myxococcota bacterium]
MPLGTLLAFGVPASGIAFYILFIQFYFLKFATDVLLIAPAAIGLLFGAGRIWDAVSDPLVGYWSDRTRTRIGRRRPWMFAALPLLAVTFVMVWSPPAGLGSGALVAWSAVGLVGFYTAFTIYSVPHLSLGAELSDDHHERSRIFAVQRMAFTLGMMLAFAGIQYVSNAQDERATASGFAVLVAVGVTLLLLLPPAVLREPARHQGRGATSAFGALRDVLRNPHARILLSVWFIDSLGGGVLGVLAPFVTEYILGRPDLIGVIPAFFVFAGVAAIPVWVYLSRRFGKRNVWIVGMLGTSGFFGATFFVGEGDLVLLAGLLVGAGASMGCGGVIGQSMLADVVDYDEYTSGERKEGSYYAAWGFALKLAMGLVTMGAGTALQLAGFQPNVEQTETAKLALSGIFAGVPFFAFLLGALLFRRFRLDQAEHGRIRAELLRRAEEPAAPPHAG